MSSASTTPKQIAMPPVVEEEEQSDLVSISSDCPHHNLQEEQLNGSEEFPHSASPQHPHDLSYSPQATRPSKPADNLPQQFSHALQDNEIRDQLKLEQDEESFRNNTTAKLQHDATTELNGLSPSLEALAALPSLRAIPWKPGKELPHDKALGSDRTQVRGSCLLATRAEPVAHPCELCSLGRGRFTGCFALTGWYLGACASCVFNAKGSKCTLRTRVLGDVDARGMRFAADADVATVKAAVAAHHTIASQSQAQVQSNPAGTLKRRRRPTSRFEAGETNGTSRGGEAHRPAKRSRASAGITRFSSGGARRGSDLEFEPQSTDEYYDYENYEPVRGDVSPPRASGHGYSPEREAPPYGFTATTTAPGTYSHEGHGQERLGGHPDGEDQPLIDMLPRAKQRQIYGVMAGLQGGIDSLQKQLSFLEGMLGIEPIRP